MVPKDVEIAKALKKALATVVHLLDFRVFGSRAKGNQDEFSDMDVFIEIPSVDDALREKIRDITWEVGFDNSMVISILIFSEDRLKKAISKHSPILNSIMKDGIKI